MVRRFSILVMILILGLIPVAISAGSGFQGGSGSVSNPYQIINAQQLYNMRTNLSANYILMANIDLSSYNNWEPIGNFNARFNGSLNGNGYKISNLMINRSSGDYQALFGAMDPAGILKNLKLEAVNIAGGSRVGGLVGYDKGTIQDSYVVGSIIGSSFVGGMVGEKSDGKINNSYTNVTIKATSDRVGGLIGSMNVGTIYRSYSLGSVTGTGAQYGGLIGHSNRVTIEECFASVNVTTSKGRVGGLIGHTESSTIIKKSFATGNVTSAYTGANMNKVFYTGGLVGWNEAEIENCYATGTVSGNYRVGGLVGRSKNIITNSYAVGSIKARKDLGGLIGYISDSVVTTSSYYDLGMSHDEGKEKGIAKTTSELKDINTFDDWDFNNTWVIAPSKNNGFPYLQFADSFVGPGNGTISYEIATVEQLNAIRNNPYAHYKLVADIDLDNYDWQPVGDWSVPFRGSLDGNGYAIKNLTINTSLGYAGLIGILERTGVLENVVLENVNVVGKINVGSLAGYSRGIIQDSRVNGKIIGDTYAGGLVGVNNEGRILRSHAIVNVLGDKYIGGLVGYNCGIIFKDYTTGTVDGGSYVGGLVGTNGKGRVSFCYANVVITATSDRVGGLIGHNAEGTILQCYAMGNISGNGIRYGGLVGHCHAGTIDSCFSLVNVTTSETPVGGLVGQTEPDAIIKFSFATGNVTSISMNSGLVGGLVGKSKGKISNCYATGSVKGYSWIGGLVGQAENTVLNSYAIGSVKSVENRCGGLIAGFVSPNTVVANFYNWETSGVTDNGIGIPKSTAEMKNINTYIGWDFNTVWKIDPSINNGYPFLGYIFHKMDIPIIDNVLSNSSLTKDLTWSGLIDVYNNLTVPAGVTLTIQPGTVIRVRDGCSIRVQGAIVASDPNQGIVFDSLSGTWDGLIIEASGTESLNGLTVRRAVRGVAGMGNGTINLTNCNFAENLCGIHCYRGNINVNRCSFTNNRYYGIKEDNGNNPVVQNCVFQGNGINYYDGALLEITIEQLNNTPNLGNVFQ